MKNLEEIQSAVAKLPREELSVFREWFEEVAAGRLDAIAKQAMRDFEEGRCTELCITDRNTLGIVLHPQYISPMKREIVFYRSHAPRGNASVGTLR